MDLKDFIRKVFPMKDDERYSKMIDNLKRLGFDSVSDLKYLDEESTKELEAFSRIEIKRLTDHLTKFEIETLDDVLDEIFDGIPEKRIREIKIFLNEREIYVRKDILVINIMEMRKELFFSENEFLKIENFLQKYNNRYYEEIVMKQKLKESDLTPALYEIFSGADESRISKIEEILKNQDITAEKHLVYIDIDKFRREKILADIEISKIESYLEENHKEQFEKIKERKEFKDSNNLNYVLDKILCDTPLSRLEEIEEILKKEEIYSGKDILITDLNGLQLKVSLSNAEMLKLEDYIKKNNLEHYQKIMRERELKKSNNTENYKKIMDEKRLELASALNEIFIGVTEERVQEIEDILKKHDINARKDLIYFEPITFKNNQLLKDSEIAKVETYLETNHKEQYDKIEAARKLEKHDPSNFDHVVNELFSGTHAQRLAEIKQLLNKEDIYNGMDVLVIDTNKLRENGFFSDIEILKIEDYIRKNNPKRYDEIRAAKIMKDEIQSMDLKGKKEIELFSLRELEEVKYLELKLQANKDIKALEMNIHKEKERLECDKKQIEITRLKSIQENKLKSAEFKRARITKERYYQSLDMEKKNLQEQVFKMEQVCTQCKKNIAQIEGGWAYIGKAKDLEGEKCELKETRELVRTKKLRIEEIEQELQTNQKTLVTK